MNAKQLTKRRYNLTYKARKKGFIINTRKKQVVAYFDDLTRIIKNHSVTHLITEFGFAVVENWQLKIKFKGHAEALEGKTGHKSKSI